MLIKLFNAEESAEIVNSLVKHHRKFPKSKRRTSLIINCLFHIKNGPERLHTNSEILNPIVFEVFNQVANILGYSDIDFPAEAEQLKSEPVAKD